MTNDRVSAAIGTHKWANEGCGSIYIDSADNAECAVKCCCGKLADRLIAPKLNLYDSLEKDALIYGLFMTPDDDTKTRNQI